MNLCLIGGGNKAPIVQEALQYTGDIDGNTNVLLVPSACSTQAAYDRKVPAHLEMFAEFGVPTEVLHDFNAAPKDIATKFGSAAMIFTIAGNLPHLLKTISDHDMADHYRQAAVNGRMLAGTSAGALLPFAIAHSNRSNKKDGPSDFALVPALGIVPAAACVHADVIDPTSQLSRLEDFEDRLAGRNETGDSTLGLAIENNASLTVVGGIAKIIRSNTLDPSVYIVETEGGTTSSRRIEDDFDMGLVYGRLSGAD